MVGAVSIRDPAASPPSVDVADATAAVLRFDRGAVGSFANTRRIATAVIEIEFVSDGLLTTLLAKRPDRARATGRSTFDDGDEPSRRSRRARSVRGPGRGLPRRGRGRRPGGVLSTYADALRTDRLTRAVVAATGAPG